MRSYAENASVRSHSGRSAIAAPCFLSVVQWQQSAFAAPATAFSSPAIFAFSACAGRHGAQSSAGLVSPYPRSHPRLCHVQGFKLVYMVSSPTKAAASGSPVSRGWQSTQVSLAVVFVPNRANNSFNITPSGRSAAGFMALCQAPSVRQSPRSPSPRCRKSCGSLPRHAVHQAVRPRLIYLRGRRGGCSSPPLAVDQIHHNRSRVSVAFLVPRRRITRRARRTACGGRLRGFAASVPPQAVPSPSLCRQRVAQGSNRYAAGRDSTNQCPSFV